MSTSGLSACTFIFPIHYHLQNFLDSLESASNIIKGKCFAYGYFQPVYKMPKDITQD